MEYSFHSIVHIHRHKNDDPLCAKCMVAGYHTVQETSDQLALRCGTPSKCVNHITRGNEIESTTEGSEEELNRSHRGPLALVKYH